MLHQDDGHGGGHASTDGHLMTMKHDPVKAINDQIAAVHKEDAISGSRTDATEVRSRFYTC